MENRKNIIVATFVAAILIVVGIVYWFSQSGKAPVSTLPPQPEQSASGVPEAISASLGGELYRQAQNPIAAKIPEVNSIESVNPLANIYRNPFE